MARIVEGQLPYTAGDGIEITANKVIKVLLREENNLIKLNGDNELYTDLQLVSGIKPSDEFPVGVTVGKILASDGWTRNGLILNRKTTSGDYARWIYGADGEIYFGGGNGTWKQVYYSDEVDALFTQLRGELATVAFTGDYNDLDNKPTIPIVNDGTLTIQKNGTNVAIFTANQSENQTANITVPTTVAELTDSGDYVTNSELSTALGDYTPTADLAAVALSNSYTDLSNKPTIPSVINNVTSTDTNNALSANQGRVLNNSISTINGKIPSAATSSNQLADKDYVNDSINSVTAYYITKDAQGNQFATYAELSAATTFYSGGEVRVPTRNDYTIVLDDETHNDEVTRYIYNNGWEYQYTINESPLTQAQLNALNSGITSGKVTSYDSVVATIANYGNIVTHNTSEFATSTQGALADSALQPNDNISELNNDAGFITGVNWGSIGGTLSNQVDLNNALGAKADDNAVVHIAGTETVTGAKTFDNTLVVNTDNNEGLVVQSASGGGYLYVNRGTGDNAVKMAIKSGSSGGTFGTETDHQFQFRTNNVMRMQIDGGSNGGKVQLATTSIPAAGDSSNYVPSTSWVQGELSGKQDTLTAGTGIDMTSNTISSLNNFGTSSTAAATAQKEVSIPGIKTLNVGQVIHVLPSTASTVANSTIKLNNFTAYPMRYNNAAITTSTDSIVRPANIVTSFVFDGTYWQFLGHGLDSNTTYSNMSATEANTGTATTARTISASVLKGAIETHAPVQSVNGQTGDVSLTIPTVNNGTLTINQGGASKGTFTANQSSASTVSLETGKLVTQTEYNNISGASSDGNLYIIYKTV